MSLDQRHSPRPLLEHGALHQTDKRCCPGKLPDNPRALHTTQHVTKANLTKQEKIWTIVFTREGGQKKARFSGKKEGGRGGREQLIVRVDVKLSKSKSCFSLKEDWWFQAPACTALCIRQTCAWAACLQHAPQEDSNDGVLPASWHRRDVGLACPGSGGKQNKIKNDGESNVKPNPFHELEVCCFFCLVRFSFFVVSF